jgi:hypothetical protein
LTNPGMPSSTSPLALRTRKEFRRENRWRMPR